jgi:hypothetical protein
MTTPLNVSEFNPGIGSRPVGTAVSIFNGALHVIGGDGNHNPAAHGVRSHWSERP